MSNQPYEGYDPGFDPHQQHSHPQQSRQQEWYDPSAGYPQQPSAYPQHWDGQSYGPAQPLPPESQAYDPHGYAAHGVGGRAHPSGPGGTATDRKSVV